MVLSGDLNVGDRINSLTLVKCLSDGEYNDKLWECICDCGDIVVLSSLQLLNGIHNCGHDKFIDIAGMQFNDLTALMYTGKGFWICKCKCGALTKVSGTDLRKYKTHSCSSCSQLYDLTGKTIDTWEVLYRAPSRNRKTIWHCKCTECGKERDVFADSLLGGRTKGCTCHRATLLKKVATTHGMSKTRFYRIWYKTRRKCLDPKDSCYYKYGGRGITICDRWKDSFENFRDDMYESYLKHVEEFGEKETSINRIDNDGNYCPENCEWATNKEQANNKRSSHFIIIGEERHTLSEWCEILNVSKTTVYYRINNLGMSAVEALTVPINEKYSHRHKEEC